MIRLRDDIYAVEGGVVFLVLTSASAYGNRIYIRHDDGSTAMYAHLSKFECSQGDCIQAGDKIGVMGDTGNGSGTHLHISYFSKYAKELRGEYASDPTYWIILSGFWPTNTKVSGGYQEMYKDANGNSYPHEGIDFCYSELIDGWANTKIDTMAQDMRIQL